MEKTAMDYSAQMDALQTRAAEAGGTGCRGGDP
jgi:hypothetical protein